MSTQEQRDGLYDLLIGGADDNEREAIFIDHTRDEDLEYIADVNYRVANALFPERTSSSMFLKMYGEIAELVKEPTKCEEAADAIIMLMDHIVRMGGNVGQEILKKLERNLQRSWKLDEETGVYHHIK